MGRYFPIRSGKEMLRNLKGNWLFLISGVAFLCTQLKRAKVYYLGLIVAGAVLAAFSTQHENILRRHRTGHWAARAFYALTTLGICLYGFRNAEEYLAMTTVMRKLSGTYLIAMSRCVAAVGAVAGFAFVYAGVSCLWHALHRIAAECSLIPDKEFGGGRDLRAYIPFLIFIPLVILAVTLVFIHSEAFYGAKTLNVIYSTDSRNIIARNAHLDIFNVENDLRQPLFAVFSAPFTGAAYLIAYLFGDSVLIWALLVNYVQTLLLFASFCLFAKMMHLSTGKRVCFLLLSCCSYPYLLYSFTMEQYVIAVFWLSLSVYLISEERESCPIPLYAATGTLLTSGMWILVSSSDSPFRQFGKWIRSMVQRCMGFAALLLAFNRFDIIAGILSQVKLMVGYGGIEATFAEKLRQFLMFVRNCFFAPTGYVKTLSAGNLSWQPLPVDTFDFAGIIIIAMLVASRIVNREKRSSRLAFGWFVFSFILLVGLGWGAKENCLILYTLYFGWAILMLLFQLVEWIAERVHSRLLVPLVSAAGVCAFLAVNLPEMCRMIAFAIESYPR